MKSPKQKNQRTRTVKNAGVSLVSLQLPRNAAILVIACAAILVYANSIAGQFVFDDTVIIQGNKSIQALDPAHLKEIFGGHYWKAVESQGGLYRPIVMLSYALNYALGTENPVGYHLINVLIHAANGIVLFLVLELLFARRAFSFLSAMLFVLHPIRTEGVASIVGRAESLSALFLLLGWYAYLKHRKGNNTALLYLSAFSFALAALCKESAFVFIVFPMLSDWVLDRSKPVVQWLNRAALLRYLPVCIALLAVLALRFQVLGGLSPLYIDPNSNPLAGLGIWDRFVNATSILSRYLGLLVLPVNLSADYSYNQVPIIASILSWQGWAPLLLLALLLCGLLYSFRRAPEYFFCGFVFFASFMLVSNWIQPIGTIMGERLMYFPAIGFNCLLALLLIRGISNHRWEQVFQAFLIVILVGYGIGVVRRNSDWKDNYSLFESALQTSPNSALVQSNYATLALMEKHNPADAAEHAKIAARISPQDPAARFTLARAYARLGEVPQALDAYAEVVRLAPRTSGGSDALRGMAEAYESLGKYDQAANAYETLVEWRPKDVTAYLALQRAYVKSGQSDKAAKTLERVAAIAPNDPRVAKALQQAGR
jgi:protein O-mannosyl-transferase